MSLKLLIGLILVNQLRIGMTIEFAELISLKILQIKNAQKYPTVILVIMATLHIKTAKNDDGNITRALFTLVDLSPKNRPDMSADKLALGIAAFNELVHTYRQCRPSFFCVDPRDMMGRMTGGIVGRHMGQCE